MLRRLKSYIRSEKGAVLPWMAMMFPLLIGMAGLGVDVSHWMMMKRKLQIAADAAAMAGGFDIANSRSQDYATSAATTQATANGWTTTGGGTIAVSYSVGSAGTTVTVNIKQKAYMWFADYFLNGTIYVGTTAASYVETSNGPYCMLSLDPSAHDAISVTGTVDVNAAGCGIAVNSNQSDALYLNGNVFVNVGDVHLAGGDSLVGNSYTFDYTGLQTYASQTTDPYSSLSIPSVSEPVYSNQTSTTLTSAGNSTTCTDDQLKNSNANKWTGGTVPLKHGRYCGGISVSGGSTSISMEAGVYIMDGGSFNMSGGGTISCSNCTGNAGITIILTNTNTSKGSWGAISISGGGNVYLPAPKVDPTNYPGFSGIAIYQDRNCGTSCAGNTVTGNANLQIEGVAYAPNGSFKYGGTTTVSGASDCTKVIAKTISFNGTPEMGNSCTNSGTKGIGTPQVTLVL